jgi:hypothetical protein
MDPIFLHPLYGSGRGDWYPIDYRKIGYKTHVTYKENKTVK